jgi:hypothetical protein
MKPVSDSLKQLDFLCFLAVSRIIPDPSYAHLTATRQMAYRETKAAPFNRDPEYGAEIANRACIHEISP